MAPNTEHPGYTANKQRLQTVADVWDDLEGVKTRYLPREPGENAAGGGVDPYLLRAGRSAFTNKFRPAIEGFAGLLASDFEDLPVSLTEAQSDVDGEGSNLVRFLEKIDTISLRDGVCVVLVEYPELEAATNRAEETASPYLVGVDIRNVINLRVAEDGSLSLLVIRELFTIESPDDPYSSEEIEQYRIYENSDGVTTVTLAQESGLDWVYGPAVEISPNQIPAVWYQFRRDEPYCYASPTFWNLAKLNLLLFRLQSDQDYQLHQLACPIPYRVWEGGVPVPTPPLISGANTVNDLGGTGSKIGFAEISGNGLELRQQRIQEVKADIDQITMNFSLLPGSRTRAEVELSATTGRSTLQSFALSKQSLFEEIVSLWCQYTGEAPTGRLVQRSEL